MRLPIVSAALVGALAAIAVAFASSSHAVDRPPSYYTPAWSPNGQEIAFTDSSDFGGPAGYPGDLYVMSADGTNVRKLTANGNLRGATYPTWSPDGKKIAFQYRGASATAAIYVIGRDGTGLDRISPPLFGDVCCPDWSRSGRRIAFANTTAREQGTGDSIWVIGPHGNFPALVAKPPSTLSYRSPAWSPDGEQMAFTVEEAPTGMMDYAWGGHPDDIPPFYFGIVRSYRGHVRGVTTGSFAYDPDWSPDGKKVVYSTGTQIKVVVLKTGRRTTLHSGEHPRWSPDGRKIVFSDRDGRPYGASSIYVMSADGSNVSRLAPR